MDFDANVHRHRTALVRNSQRPTTGLWWAARAARPSPSFQLHRRLVDRLVDPIHCQFWISHQFRYFLSFLKYNLRANNILKVYGHKNWLSKRYDLFNQPVARSQRADPWRSPPAISKCSLTTRNSESVNQASSSMSSDLHSTVASSPLYGGGRTRWPLPSWTSIRIGSATFTTDQRRSGIPLY